MKKTPSSVPEIIRNLNPVTEQFGPLSQNSGQMQIPGTAEDRPTLKSTLKKHPKTPSQALDISEDIENAAAIGGNAMVPVEPLGPVIGALMGATEEAVALLQKKKPIKAKRK